MATHYLNGKWVDSADLKISVMDLAVLRGFGVFDYLRTYNQRPFHLPDHIVRFFNSAKLLGLEIPVGRDELNGLILEGIHRNKYDEYGIRLLMSGGISEDSITPGDPTLIIVFQPVALYARKLYTEGAKVITFPTPRYIAEAKSLNYLTAIIAMQKAHKQGAIEAIYIDSELSAIAEHTSRKLYEGTRTNFFIVKDDVLVTPDSDMLPGITRKLVIETAEKLGLPVEERGVEVGELASAHEAFITSSDKEIMPVVQIDKQVIGDGKVGPVVLKLMKTYREYTDAN